MLVLLLAGGLAVAPADTALRLPGTHLRLGTLIERITAYGDFAPPAAPQAGTPNPRPHPAPPPGVEVREGPARFFGVDATARLMFEEHRLAKIEFEVQNVSSHSYDYIEDQLRRLGLRRECARYGPGVRSCDWLGRTRLHVELEAGTLVAQLTPFARPPALTSLPDSARAPAAAPALALAAVAATVPADTLWLGLPTDSLPAPVAIATCKPERPAAARSQGVFGRVTVSVLVDTDGRVIDAQIQRGIAALNDAALECARRFQFQPYVWHGRGVRFRHELPLTFLLD